jgi:hypothetical protein
MRNFPARPHRNVAKASSLHFRFSQKKRGFEDFVARVEALGVGWGLGF